MHNTILILGLSEQKDLIDFFKKSNNKVIVIDNKKKKNVIYGNLKNAAETLNKVKKKKSLI